MKRTPNFLYILFYTLIIVDAILLIFFFIYPNFLQKPQFITNSQEFTFREGEIKLLPGNLDHNASFLRKGRDFSTK